MTHQSTPAQPLTIGISACFFYPDPARTAFAKKTLFYVEESVPRWLRTGGALPVMVPPPLLSDLEAGATDAHLNHEASLSLALASYAQWLDGLVLHGGTDLWPGTYREDPLDSKWLGDAMRDRYDLALLRAFVAAGKPVFGICRGMQLINVAFGGTLVQDIPTQRPEALVHRDAEIYDQNFHTIDLVPHSHLATILGDVTRAKINSVHHQCIKDLAPAFAVEARCPEDGTVEAIRHSGGPWVAGVQWHPEFHRSEDGTLDDRPILADFLTAAQKRRGH